MVEIAAAKLMKHKPNARFFAVCLCCFALYPAAYLLTRFAAMRPYTVEAVYSQWIYPFISQPISLLTGIFPFSVLEIITGLAIVFLPVFIFVCTFRSVKRRDPMIALRAIAFILAIFSAGGFIFTVGWSLNYYRPTYAELEGIESIPSETEELIKLCNELISRTSELRDSLKQDENGLVELPYSAYEAFKKVQEAYDNASVTYPLLSGQYGAPKPALFSALLSRLKIAGIFIPFTMEAHVNVMEADFMIPVTACHEAAHQRGFAREDEASFIAYRVCAMSDDPYFQYSGLMLALSNAMNALAPVDGDAWFALRETYDPGMLRDIIADSEFWKSYDTPIAQASVQLNDSFLRSNGQENGVQSYGYMVDLLIAGWQDDDVE